MGCSLSAIHDDMDDWEDFAKRAGISSVHYKVYSIESDYAKEGCRKHNLKGQLLIAFVTSKMELLQATKLHDENVKKLVAANELIK